jgi:LuxR family maltose regulon positive regulatory protein
MPDAHGWGTDRVVWTALVAVPTVDVSQGRFEDAEHWLDRADEVVPDLEPAIALMRKLARGRLHLARGRLEDAAAAFRAGARLESLAAVPLFMTAPARRLLAQTQMRLGDMAGARETLAELDEGDSDSDMARTALAHAHTSPRAAPGRGRLLVETLLLDAHAHDLLGEAQAAQSDVERALELAEPNRLIWPFVVTPARDLLEHHPRHSTAHGALLNDVLNVLAGATAPARDGEIAPLDEDLSTSELRVLRYLPANLSLPEIASELFLSSHTVKTHVRHIYSKLACTAAPKLSSAPANRASPW